MVDSNAVEIACVYTDKTANLTAANVVLVTSRLLNDELLLELNSNPDRLADADIESVTAIGDCNCPSTIAAAVHDGHRVARKLDAPPGNPDLPFRREEIRLDEFEIQGTC